MEVHQARPHLPDPERPADAARSAVLFPGQGSQSPGMIRGWLDHPAARGVVDEASEILGLDVAEAGDDQALLADTAFVQPLILVADVAAARVLEADGATWAFAAGHSLGEFAALVAAGALTFEDALQAVAERGRAMRDASAAVPGAMTALIGLSPEEADEACRVAGRGDVLMVANVNSPKQVVLSGTVAAVERAEELVRSRNARAMRLNVAGAFHSPLMAPAAARVREAIAKLRFHPPRFPIVSNVSGQPVSSPHALRDLLSRHLLSPVRWLQSMRTMANAGVTSFVEAGPGDVLTKLVKRCVPGAEAVSVQRPEDVPRALAAVPA